MCPGRISYCKNIVQIKTILSCVSADPLKNFFCIFNRSRERHLRSKPVRKIDNSKTVLGKPHTIPLINILIAINPRTTVNTYYHRKLFEVVCTGTARPVNIKQLPLRKLRVIAISNIIKTNYISRCCLPCITFLVAAPKILSCFPSQKLVNRINHLYYFTTKKENRNVDNGFFIIANIPNSIYNIGIEVFYEKIVQSI